MHDIQSMVEQLSGATAHTFNVCCKISRNVSQLSQLVIFDNALRQNQAKVKVNITIITMILVVIL